MQISKYIGDFLTIDDYIKKEEEKKPWREFHVCQCNFLRLCREKHSKTHVPLSLIASRLPTGLVLANSRLQVSAAAY